MADGPISNQDYDIISVVYHAAQGAETLRKYMGDAQQGGGGQQGASQLFQQALQQYEQIAQQGLQLLRGGQGGQGG